MPDKKDRTEAEREAERKRRADEFWNIFLFTKNGKIKSTLLVNSFSLSILFLAVYFLSYYLLIDLIDMAVASVFPVWLANICESLLPGVIAAGLCCLLLFVFKERRLVPLAHLWLLLYALVMLIGVAVGLDAEVRAFFLALYASFVLPGVLIGGALSVLLYLRYQRNHPPVESIREKRPWEK